MWFTPFPIDRVLLKVGEKTYAKKKQLKKSLFEMHRHIYLFCSMTSFFKFHSILTQGLRLLVVISIRQLCGLFTCSWRGTECHSLWPHQAPERNHTIKILGPIKRQLAFLLVSSDTDTRDSTRQSMVYNINIT